MSRRIPWLVAGVAGSAVVAPVVSYLSGFATVFVDRSEAETVGVIALKGFPIWFYEAADGISIMSGWHPTRFVLNAIVWFSVFSALIIYASDRAKRKIA